MNIFEFWNEASEFPLFLMAKFALIYECLGLRACFRNELCSQTKVPLYKENQDNNKVVNKVSCFNIIKVLYFNYAISYASCQPH
jgi:hypothetical protein